MNLSDFQSLILTSDVTNDWLSFELMREDFTGTFVLKKDLNVRIMSRHSETAEFHAGWANCFADKRAHGVMYELCYASSLVEQMRLVVVDGGRAILPMPDARVGTITRWKYTIGRIVNQRHERNVLDDYLKQASISVDG